VDGKNLSENPLECFEKNVIPGFFQSPRHSFEISTMVQVCNLRDYHDELKPMVDIMDPAFKPQDLSIWTENLPTIANQGTNSTDQLVASDKIIDPWLPTQQNSNSRLTVFPLPEMQPS